MGEASSLLALWKDISGAGLAGLLFFLLVGGRFKIWVWGYQLTEAEARCTALLAAAAAREAEWKELALAGGRIAENAVQVARRR